MSSVDRVLDDVIEELLDDSTILPAETPERIATLSAGAYRDLTPQLAVRFSRLGAWHDSTHGDWLAASEIDKLSSGRPDTPRLTRIHANLTAAAEHWADDASSLLRPERVSYFAASEFTSERVYLIWFDDHPEPEVCVYDANGESRYLDLASYLTAYLDDDAEAPRTWKLRSPA
jgi:hypothetical protein